MTEERVTSTGGTLPAVTLVAHDVGTHGGMERQLAELAEGLLARGYRVTVIARRCELDANPNLRWIRVRGPRRPFVLAYVVFFLLGSLAVARWRDGIVHSMGAIVFNRTSVVTVQFCHHGYRAAGGAPQSSQPGLAYRANAAAAAWMSRAAERFCYTPRRTRQLVAVSDGTARELERFFPAVAARRLVVIPNGVDADEFAPDPGARAEVRAQLGLAPDDLVALFLGGDWERKGLRTAIESVALASGWQLLVVGRGDEARYARIAARLGGPAIRFAGTTATPAQYFAAADAFILPTLYEAFALVTLEAAAAGLPLIVTRVNGTEELVNDGVNGWLVDRDPIAFAAHLDELGSDPQRRAAMGRAARASAKHYDWARVVESSAAVYAELARR